MHSHLSEPASLVKLVGHFVHEILSLSEYHPALHCLGEPLWHSKPAGHALHTALPRSGEHGCMRTLPSLHALHFTHASNPRPDHVFTGHGSFVVPLQWDPGSHGQHSIPSVYSPRGHDVVFSATVALGSSMIIMAMKINFILGGFKPPFYIIANAAKEGFLLLSSALH
jgi:hypothetical protein